LSPVTIRKATVNDIPAIVNLVQSVYRGDNSRQGWTTEADLLDGPRTDPQMVSDFIADPASVMLVAFKDGQLAASVLLQKKSDHAYLGMLSVDVRAQNLKLGRWMMDECAAFIRAEWKLAEIRISVIDSRHELIEWYERRGFKRSGRGSEFSSDPRFGIPKVAGIKFIEMVKPI
jgi:ribosomal protein S18 acetylase RimI-like enzyme